MLSRLIDISGENAYILERAHTWKGRLFKRVGISVGTTASRNLPLKIEKHIIHVPPTQPKNFSYFFNLPEANMFGVFFKDMTRLSKLTNFQTL